jgi:hypothetical protein
MVEDSLDHVSAGATSVRALAFSWLTAFFLDSSRHSARGERASTCVIPGKVHDGRKPCLVFISIMIFLIVMHIAT